MVTFYEETKTFLQIKQKRVYFIPNGNKLRGRPKTTLPIVFNRDLSLIQDQIRLHSSEDLAEITELAQDRKCWRGLTSRIEKAAKVSQTKNWDAKRQQVSKSRQLYLDKMKNAYHYYYQQDIDEIFLQTSVTIDPRPFHL